MSAVYRTSVSSSSVSISAVCPTIRTDVRRRGGAIVGVLLFILVSSTAIIGVSTSCTMHLQRATVDMNYTKALDLAEAGINYEFRRISPSGVSADQYPGTTTSFGGGTFRVYVTNHDGSTPWVPPNDLYVISTGTVNGVSRTVKAQAKGLSIQSNYALFGINNANLVGNVTIDGDVGTNGSISWSGTSIINGTVYADGPAATTSGSGAPVVNMPFPVAWPTVDQKALQLFPNSGATTPGGLAYLALHNDNARAVPPIIGNIINNTSVKLVGPGDYYVTSIKLTGNSQMEFDNRLGPIRIWVGPSGGVGTVDFVGTTDGSTDVTAGGYQVDLLVGTSGTVNFKGTSSVRANVYAYNKDLLGNSIGNVVLSGTPDIFGSVIAYNASKINGNPTIHYTSGVQLAPTIGYFGFDTSWLELNPR